MESADTKGAQIRVDSAARKQYKEYLKAYNSPLLNVC